MFELTLCLACERQKFISSFFKQIEKDIKKDGGIIVKQNFGGKSYLAIAVVDEKKDYVIPVIPGLTGYLPVMADLIGHPSSGPDRPSPPSSDLFPRHPRLDRGSSEQERHHPLPALNVTVMLYIRRTRYSRLCESK